MTYLTSVQGLDLVARAEALRSEGADTLRALTRLRKYADPEQAVQAWELTDLRSRAASKIGPQAHLLFFDRDGYEMASSTCCAAYHARRLTAIGAPHVVDVCAGVGIDACRVALSGMRVTAYELDPTRAEMARANAAALGVSDRVDVITGDATKALFPREATAAFFDPARRSKDRKRIVSPEDVTPPLSFLETLRNQGIENVLVKLSPAIDRALGSGLGASTEFLSDGGECKEALLGLGDLRLAADVSAVKLPEIVRVNSPAPAVAVEAKIGNYVYEPDPAVIRAGLIGHVADSVSGWLFYADVAYVMSDHPAVSPLAEGYRVVESFPYHAKALQKALNARGVGRVIIKKRAFPHEPDEVRKLLKLSGPNEATVILTRDGPRLWAMIVERIA